jgi:ADP-ribose pyrophosphatase
VAIRELEEETGWIARKVIGLGGYYPAVGYSDEVIYVFIAEDLTPGEVKFVDGEFIETIRLPLEEALDMVRRGEIRDMKTIAALYVAAVHRSNGKPV